MNSYEFRVEPADYHADFDELRALREEVFIVEQHIPKTIEFDSIDSSCYHFIARDNFHHPIGTARLTQDHKIGRMAVLANWRRKGVGKALLSTVIDKARKLGWTELTLSAQTEAIGFYEKFGFSKVGDVFQEATIPHQHMHLAVEPTTFSKRPPSKSRDSLVEISDVKNIADNLSANLDLIGEARRQICIFSRDLEPLIYANPEIVEALKQFAINSKGGTVNIIVQDTLAVRSQPHPLIELVQRLPSIFTLKTPIEVNDLQYPSTYLINDRDGYLFRQQSSQFNGVWSPILPSRNRQLTEEFDRVWQRCRVCSEFRALGL